MDSGAGVTLEEATRLSAADGPLPRSASGTGLGLAIARAVVAARGGRLTVEGRSGQGATVTLHFPRCRDDERSIGDHTRAAGADH